MTEAWVNDGCREIQAARRAGEHEIAAELARFIERVLPPRKERLGLRGCEVCGNVFVPRAWNHRSCSDQCRGSLRYLPKAKAERVAPPPRRPRFCKWCADEIRGTGRKFCSGPCQKAHAAWEISSTTWDTAEDEARTTRMLEVMRREPDLSTWALAERFGVSEDAVRSLRHRAGLPPPEPWRAGWRA